MHQTEWVICENINCKKRFKRTVKGSTKFARKKALNIRGAHCNTCCPECSKENNYNKYHTQTQLKDGIIFNC